MSTRFTKKKFSGKKITPTGTCLSGNVISSYTEYSIDNDFAESMVRLCHDITFVCDIHKKKGNMWETASPSAAAVCMQCAYASEGVEGEHYPNPNKEKKRELFKFHN